MRLFNTATGEMAAVPTSGHLRVYVCGITPYAATHIGHAMVYLAYDLLIRRLRDQGLHVTLVRNVTDVDDSILEYAREHNLDYADLAVAEVARFTSEMAQREYDPDAVDEQSCGACDGCSRSHVSVAPHGAQPAFESGSP